MKVINMLQQKGGAGKTTTCINIAACLARSGNRVVLIDCDLKQASASRWDSESETHHFDVVAIEPIQLKAYIKGNNDLYDYAIIDTRPEVDADAGRLIQVSDLVLMPIQPSPFDVWGCEDMLELVMARKEMTADLPNTPEEGLPVAHFLFVMVEETHKIFKDTLEAIDHAPIDALDAHTNRRTAYKRSAAEGESVFSEAQPDIAACYEVKSVCHQIERALQWR